MGKRKLTDVPSWWTVVVEEVRSNGGFVNSNLGFSESSRELTVENETIDPCTLLMRIPSSTLVSQDRAVAIAPWLKEIKNKMASAKLHAPFSDICLAMAMASQSKKTLSYLETLPDPSTFDALPRRWTERKLEELLKGSPLLERAKKTKHGVRNDYDLVQKAWNEIEEKSTFPSFERYSDMLAAVSSRAFGVGDSDEDTAMIPILDLCDHSRGRDTQKNVTYKRLEDGSIEVKSTQSIEQNEHLRLTYGARGNSQLLLNYGFTIPRNLEPDGSSNDVLEFSLDGTNAVHLRTGPKSYTYGGLVKALEQACATAPGEDREEAEEDDMEAFLNECEESEELDIYDETTGVDEGNDGETDVIQRELEALRTLREALEKRLEAYICKGTELKETPALAQASPSYYSALLLQSEQRTTYFFTRATNKIEALLRKQASPEPKKVDMKIDKEDLELIEAQTEELAQAFMKIRHGDIL